MDHEEVVAEFVQAVKRLDEALKADISEDMKVDLVIQRFEFTFELAWKSIKKKLREQEGIDAPSPRQALQNAYRLSWIHDENLWIGMMTDRNLTSHVYKASMARQIYQRITGYYPVLRDTALLLSNQE